MYRQQVAGRPLLLKDIFTLILKQLFLLTAEYQKILCFGSPLFVFLRKGTCVKIQFIIRKSAKQHSSWVTPVISWKCSFRLDVLGNVYVRLEIVRYFCGNLANQSRKFYVLTEKKSPSQGLFSQWAACWLSNYWNRNMKFIKSHFSHLLLVVEKISSPCE